MADVTSFGLIAIGLCLIRRHVYRVDVSSIDSFSVGFSFPLFACELIEF
jgi:hypothetical protein